MSYEIRVISNEEFDTLPYKHVKRALGLADAKNNVAYIRHTGVKELDARTIDHEFDELMMKVSPHEEDGIRYKFWIPLILAALKSAAVGAAVGGTVTKIQGGDFWKGALQGAKYGAIGSGLGSALGGVGGAMSGSTNAALSNVGGGLSKVGSLMGGANLSSPAASSTGSLPGFGVGGNTVSSGVTSGAQAGSQGALSGFAGGSGTAAGAASALTTSAPPPSGTPSVTPSAGQTPTAMSGFNVPTPPPGVSPTGIGAGIGAASAPAGTSLTSKFGNFTLDRAQQFAGNELKTMAGNAILPSETGLYPEYRTPASGYGSEGALSRFAPSLAAPGSYTPLTQEDYQLGLSNLYGAKKTRMADIFDTPAFRGQTPEQNSGLAQQIAGLNEGFDLELGQYNRDVDTENTYRRYDSIKKENNLTDDLMSQYIALAGKPDDIIAQSVTNSPEEFRSLFKGLTMRA